MSKPHSTLLQRVNVWPINCKKKLNGQRRQDTPNPTPIRDHCSHLSEHPPKPLRIPLTQGISDKKGFLFDVLVSLDGHLHSSINLDFHLLSWQWLNIPCYRQIITSFFFKIYWSVVDLQCVHFYCPAKWFSYIYIYIHILFSCSPLWFITEYWI